MKRIVIPVAAVLCLAAATLAVSSSFLAQDRHAEATAALARADAAYEMRDFARAAEDYARAAENLPAGDGRDRALLRTLVCLSESGGHPRLESMNRQPGLAAYLGGIAAQGVRVDALRLAGLYFAGRDHDYHQHRDGVRRDYRLDPQTLPERERADWSYVNTAASDVAAGRSLIALAHEASRALLDLAAAPTRAQQERHVALTLEYCDLLEVTDRLQGRARNEMHFFGSDYGIGGAAPVPEQPAEPEFPGEETPEDWEDETPTRPVVDANRPEAAQPGQEPFTRRGYFLQPDYPSLPTIQALMETAVSRAGALGDKALQAAVLYRRASLMLNVGLYGNAALNARLTDWRNGSRAEPDPARDPRPLLRRLLAEHKGSIWDDEARFLLGYVAYYLNDFGAARAEFALLEKDHPQSRYIGEARRLVQVIEFPQLFTSFSTGASDNALVAPGQPLSISVHARNVEAVRVSLRPLDLAKVMAAVPNAAHAWADLAELAKLPGFEAALGPSMMDQSFVLAARSPHFYHSRESLPLYTRMPGVFVLEVSGGPVLERKLVQVADLAVQRRRLDRSEQFWVTTRDGRPLRDVFLRVGYHENLHVAVPYRERVAVDPADPARGTTEVTRFRAERKLVEHTAAGATDANGLFETALPPHSVRNFWATLDVAGALYLVNDPNPPASIEAPAPWLPQPVPVPRADLRAFVYSDRPVYRPGDTAFLRLITRLPMGEGKLEGEPMLLRVLHQGIEQHRAELVLNDFGCAVVRFDIPVGAPLGDYDVLVSSPRLGGDNTFRLVVQEYFKKDVRLEIEAPSGPLAAGSMAEVPVLFRYLAGGTVQGAEVRYTVDARSADGRAWRPVAARANTNIDGRVLIPLDTGRISKEAGGRAVTLTISADGTGPGGQISAARATLKISGSGISVAALWPDTNWHSAGSLPLTLRVTDTEGRRLAAEGSYVVWRITDQSSLRSQDWTNPSIRRLQTQSFNDEARFDSVAIAMPRESGRYFIEVRGKAGEENFELTHRVLLVARGDLDNRLFALLPERDQFDLTRPCRVLLCQPEAGQVLFSLHADGSEDGYRTVQAPATGIHEVALQEQHAPHRHLCARAVRGGRHLAAQYAVAIRPASRAIRTTVRFDKAQYRPGETASAEIFTFNQAGAPVEAEVALGVWDSALRDFAASALDSTSLYDHFFAGTTRFAAQDDNLGESTRVRPTRRNDARVRRWRTHAMPPGSFFYGAQSWTSTSTVNLHSLEQSPEEALQSLRFNTPARDSNSERWEDVPPSETPDPYYGDSSAVGLGGSASADGKGGFGHRRARGGGGRASQIAPDRSDFRDSAFFSADIRTNHKGVATVSFRLPDNLTEWSFEATAADRAAAIGQTSGSFKVARDLGLRMVGPRGLTDGDEIELCALVQNLGQGAASVNCEVSLNVEGAGAQLSLLRSPTPTSVSVLPGAAAEVRFRVKVAGTGLAALKVSADSGDDADSLVWKYSVMPRGMPVVCTVPFKFEAGTDVLDLAPDLPRGAILDRSSVSLQFHGSLLGSVVDALPGLVNYPHGCAEQTTNRFVPLLSVLQLLKANRLDLFQLGKARAAYDGRATAEPWPAQLTDPLELQKMVDLGFGNLRRYQNSDGGWGWFSWHGSSPHLSATVLAGLCSARGVAPGVGLSLPATDAVMDVMFERGARFLLGALADPNLDAALRGRALHAAAWAISMLPPAAEGAAEVYAPLRELLQTRLNAGLAALGNDPARALAQAGGSAGLASLVLAMHHAGRPRDVQQTGAILLAAARPDARYGLLFPAGADESARWHDTEIEAHALAVQALAAAVPANPALRRAVDGLLLLKSGTGWGNTRATGQAVQALAAYLAVSAEEAAEARVTIHLGGSSIGTFERSRDRLISARTRWDLGGAELKGAALSLRRSGKGAVSGCLTVRAFMPLDDGAAAAASGLRVLRGYSRRTATEREIEVEVRDQRGNVLERRREMKVEYQYSPLGAGDVLKVGDIITVTISVSGRPGDRYLCIEDARPSCLEPISSRFEEIPGLVMAQGRIEVVKEERDTSTNLYADRVGADGNLSFRYECVVVAQGRFLALPARAFDMYDESRNGHSATEALEVK